MDDVSEYLKAQEASLLTLNYPDFIKDFFLAQTLSSRGKDTEALTLYHKAYHEAKLVREDFIYQRMYISIGMSYASILDYCGKFEIALTVYDDMLKFSPEGFFIGDYAIFLHRRKRDFELAEFYYKKSLELFPGQSSVHLKFAGFLRHVKRDLSAAENHYKMAVDTNTASAEALGSYASFLHGVKGDIDRAEKFYQQAIDADPCHSNNLCNMGLFLSEEKREYKRAELLYKQSLEVCATHPNTLYNYAVMLDTHCNRKVEAEDLYRQAIDAEPKHAFALYNLAVLLEDKYSKVNEDKNSGISLEQMMEVRDFYKRSVDADPNDATTVADYGRYLATKLDDIPAAEIALSTAIRLNPKSEVALYNLALLIHRERRDFGQAEALLRSVLNINPTHFAALVQLARVLLEGTPELKAGGSPMTGSSEFSRVMDQVLMLYEKCFKIEAHNAATAIEYLKVIAMYGSHTHKNRGSLVIQELFQKSEALSKNQKLMKLYTEIRTDKK